MGGFNVNWDASWTVATSIDSLGWYAEFRIPFSTLRYGPATPSRRGGSTSSRMIRRKNEELVLVLHSAAVQPLPPLAGRARSRRSRVPVRRIATVTPYVLGLGAGASSAGGCAGRATPAEVGGDAQVRRHAEPHARPHVQHRLRAGGGGRPAHQPHALPDLLPREAAVLPGERRRLLGRHAAGGRPLLHAPHRHRRQRRAAADHRWRPALGTRRRHHDRAAADGDRRTQCGLRRAVVHRGACGARALLALARGGHGGAAARTRDGPM